MGPDLSTTNTLLGIMVVVSLLEALALIVVIAGWLLLFRRLMQVIAGIEERHVVPVSSRVNAILDDVRGVSTVVRGATEAADSSVRGSLTWLIKQVRRIIRA